GVRAVGEGVAGRGPAHVGGVRGVAGQGCGPAVMARRGRWRVGWGGSRVGEVGGNVVRTFSPAVRSIGLSSPKPLTWVNTDGEGGEGCPAHRDVASVTSGGASRGRSGRWGPGRSWSEGSSCPEGGNAGAET